MKNPFVRIFLASLVIFILAASIFALIFITISKTEIRFYPDLIRHLIVVGLQFGISLMGCFLFLVRFFPEQVLQKAYRTIFIPICMQFIFIIIFRDITLYRVMIYPLIILPIFFAAFLVMFLPLLYTFLWCYIRGWYWQWIVTCIFVSVLTAGLVINLLSATYFCLYGDHMCFSKVAIAQQDPNICLETWISSDCITEYSLDKNDEQYCDIVKDSYEKNGCFYFLALHKNDYLICRRMEDGERKSSCCRQTLKREETSRKLTPWQQARCGIKPENYGVRKKYFGYNLGVPIEWEPREKIEDGLVEFFDKDESPIAIFRCPKSQTDNNFILQQSYQKAIGGKRYTEEVLIPKGNNEEYESVYARLCILRSPEWGQSCEMDFLQPITEREIESIRFGINPSL